MIIDRLAASLPTEGVLEHSRARRRALQNGGYIRRFAQSHPVNDRPRKSPNRIAYEHFDKILPPAPAIPKVKKFVNPETGRDWIIIKTKGSVEKIKEEVAQKHGLTPSQITSHRRARQIALARREMFYRCVEETTLSLAEIGKRCGGFNHTSVLHGHRKYKEMNGL